MRFIGITGGVGAGKSELLKYIEQEFPAKVVLADKLAHTLMLPGADCYEQIRKAFAGVDLYREDGSFAPEKLAAVIFSNPDRRAALNGIVHPAVKREVLRLADNERRSGRYAYFILEAALLIEEGYGDICDELWYIYASQKLRRQRLKESRGYSDQKIDGILKSQLSEAEFQRHCQVVIDNNGTLEESFCQIRKALEANL